MNIDSSCVNWLYFNNFLIIPVNFHDLRTFVAIFVLLRFTYFFPPIFVGQSPPHFPLLGCMISSSDWLQALFFRRSNWRDHRIWGGETGWTQRAIWLKLNRKSQTWTLILVHNVQCTFPSLLALIIFKARSSGSKAISESKRRNAKWLRWSSNVGQLFFCKEYSSSSYLQGVFLTGPTQKF